MHFKLQRWIQKFGKGGPTSRNTLKRVFTPEKGSSDPYNRGETKQKRSFPREKGGSRPPWTPPPSWMRYCNPYFIMFKHVFTICCLLSCCRLLLLTSWRARSFQGPSYYGTKLRMMRETLARSSFLFPVTWNEERKGAFLPFCWFVKMQNFIQKGYIV